MRCKTIERSHVIHKAVVECVRHLGDRAPPGDLYDLTTIAAPKISISHRKSPHCNRNDRRQC